MQGSGTTRPVREMTAEEKVEQALDLLNAFASVGVQAFDVTLTDLQGRKLPMRFYGNRHVHPLRHRIRLLNHQRLACLKQSQDQRNTGAGVIGK